MITKKEKVVWLCYALVLVALFLLSSTDLIIKEKEPVVHAISVIIDDSKDDYYVNYRKGMDQAAMDLDADISFITLYERNRLYQQVQLASRELEDGAEALILSPVNDAEMAQALDQLHFTCPIVALNSGMAQGRVVSNITFDYYGAGQELAQQIMKRHTADSAVYVFSEGLDYGNNRQLCEGVMSVLEPAGYHTSLVLENAGGSYRSVIESMVRPDKEAGVVIALDTESLTEAAEIISGSEVYGDYVEGLYGVGFTTWILDRMDRGIVQGIVASNAYEAGYLSVQKAIDAINNEGSQTSVQQKYFYITKEDIRKKEYEKVLYPMY